MQEGLDCTGIRGVVILPAGAADHPSCTEALAMTILLALEAVKGAQYKRSNQELEVSSHNILLHLAPIKCKHQGVEWLEYSLTPHGCAEGGYHPLIGKLGSNAILRLILKVPALHHTFAGGNMADNEIFGHLQMTLGFSGGKW